VNPATPRSALVTGGARRVGAAFTRALAARGYRVAIHYRTGAEEAEQLAVDLGNDARCYAADLAAAGAPAELMRQVVADFGPLDVLVNSASNFFKVPVEDVTEPLWDEVFAVNLRAPFFLAQQAAGVMRDGGCIVNMADLAAFETWPDYVPHGIAKAGIVQMTRALARQFAPRIRVNAIAPGLVLAPEDMSEAETVHFARSTPLARNGTPQDVVRALEYLIDATFVTGDVLFVDGGRHVRL
jgi:pteridine reductase